MKAGQILNSRAELFAIKMDASRTAGVTVGANTAGIVISGGGERLFEGECGSFAGKRA